MASPGKKAFLLRLNPKVFNALEEWAHDEFRSVNAQVEYLLLESLKKAGRKPAKEKKAPSTPPNDPPQNQEST